ncbi:class I SAM-dependent methyltransferase [Aeromicrobium wangtongii]|uniref:Class I SAM-dependent methyltransferase n=1 Tax=Aeromicrobium wangtongii TaxID=2969247 RepID=A0ABY5M822_9ACTN|nr:methyltransferase [Aeromicrobium wangtongii]MCD9198817.1 class I SAM-dependent methyltransferase [Aeromicrobium wangtongii]UUP13143.1 class I SAM-dependent methyltransferase [Aeromicrobium wangtongii]
MAEHYFDGSPASEDRRKDVTAVVWGREMVFTTSGGVFSHDGLDKATAVLLRHYAAPTAGVVLDLGCGWGPIACAVATTGATVWAVDVNERALELTRLNADRLGVTVHTALPDDVPDDLVVDEIWSNPPIRIGKQALHDLLLRWLPRLSPTGVARLVVGKNLGADSLQRWLVAQGWPTERVGSEQGFRILEVRRP